MRIYLSLPALVFAALLSFSAGGVQAGRFFGSVGNNTDNYQCPNCSNNSFGYGPASRSQGRHAFRHRLFHRNQGSDGVRANAMPGYGMPPGYGVSSEYMQAPTVQSPNQTPPVSMTSVAPTPVAAAPTVQGLPCSKCGQSGQVPVAPAVQSRIVPVPAPLPRGPTTAEPPPAEPAGNAPF